MIKNTFILILLLFLCLPGFSQEASEMYIMGQPKKLESGEMVARRDANGNYCAAIQVISNMDGFSYDSWNGVVGNVDSKPGKDMVFLTASERVLEIFKEGYKPLQIILSDYDINLQPREVWQIEIAGDEKAETLPVVIRFTPEDAQLFIDGNEMQISATYSLEVGEHEVKVVKNGYQILDEKVKVDQNNVLFEYQLERIKDAALQITSEPEGATVYIDGIKMGETPVAAFYPPGTYPIRIVKDGYITIENETIEIAAPNTRKDYTLGENVGYLTINTHENAKVYFNGEVVENPYRVKLTPQLVKVKVTQPKADDLEQQVLLKKDDNVVLDMYPVVKTGTIQVAVTPFDAKVELTGDAGEYFTSEGMKVFEDIPVGKYSIKVSFRNYESIDQTITLNQGEIIQESYTLLEIYKEKSFVNEIDIEMVFVEGGSFMMGCTDEQYDCRDNEYPAHERTLNDFYIGKYEITVEQYGKFIEETDYLTEADKSNGGFIWSDTASWWVKIDGLNWKYNVVGTNKLLKRVNQPVTHINSDDAIAFCDWLSKKTGRKYRLPTEEEWEYAARGGKYSKNFVFAGSNDPNEVAWYGGNDLNGNIMLHLVGELKPNELGLFDMSGNVMEYCFWSGDYNSLNYLDNKKLINRNKDSEPVVCVRGGSFLTSYQLGRVAHRMSKNIITNCIDYQHGFRIVAETAK